MPVWGTKPYLFDELGMTGAVSGSYGSVGTISVDVVYPASAMVAGRSGTVGFYTSRDTVSWGVPAAGADVALSVGGRAVAFAYPAGAVLADGSVAAGCRLTFPLWADAPVKLTADAWAMVEIARVDERHLHDVERTEADHRRAFDRGDGRPRRAGILCPVDRD